LINIHNDGSIFCTPPALIRVACKTDVANFPFDEKNCTLTFGRYTYNEYLFEGVVSLKKCLFNLSWMYPNTEIVLVSPSTEILTDAYIGKTN
jgi:hypothetical protein